MSWWYMIISGFIVVVLKIVGMTLFLLYFPLIVENGDDSFSPTESYGTDCPSSWNFHQGRCFHLSTSEMSWNKSMDMCEKQGSTLAIVNTPEKLMFLLKITGPEKYFIGLVYQHAKENWYWINNSVFNGTVTNQLQDFHCVTIGLTNTFDAVSCDTPYRYICEKLAK